MHNCLTGEMMILFVCVFVRSWDDSGLMTDIQSNGSIVIHTTHLTSFAVLVSVVAVEWFEW